MGIAWYRKEDWPQIKKIMIDAHKLHERYDDWLKAATQLEQRITQTGAIAERVYIDPEEFPRWCKARGLNVDAQGRERFGNEAVFLKYRHAN
jgi:hypothetical protein